MVRPPVRAKLGTLPLTYEPLEDTESLTVAHLCSDIRVHWYSGFGMGSLKVGILRPHHLFLEGAGLGIGG